ncbi:hypothetical protein [Sphingomonas echinoides]|uniref:hypothetical protein n=1 Tax=Sphingomonas echinoides TaxID=59803 RepID=UPI00241321CC|nr:hypothetical protein [Sphingomonas echinoides]
MAMLLWAFATMLAEGASAKNSGQEKALERASQRGALLYAYDQAAWHGTDDMLAKLTDPSNTIGGYIVDGPATNPRLIFFDKAGRKAVYVAAFRANRLVEGRVLGAAENVALSELDRRMLLALASARAAILTDSSVRACSSKPFNTVVLPPDSVDGAISVYFLTPQTSGKAIPFGGHYEVDVDASGKAGSIRHFTNSCLDMPTQPQLPSGAKPEVMFITHSLDPVPTEIHVFNSLVLGKRVLVGIPSTNTIWPIQGALIGEPVPLSKKP